jgi:hypothetical protein
MVMALVAPLATVFTGQFDAIAFNLVNAPMWTPFAPMTSMCSLISAIRNYCLGARGLPQLELPAIFRSA